MLNWFRRKSKPEEPETPPIVEETVSSPDYLDWAKTAFQNIQQRKAQEQQQEEVAETSEQEEQLQEQPQEEVVQETIAQPSWLEKSDRLEQLQEIAPETPALDEDFVWSAKVLAQSGRITKNDRQTQPL